MAVFGPTSTPNGWVGSPVCSRDPGRSGRETAVSSAWVGLEEGRPRTSEPKALRPLPARNARAPTIDLLPDRGRTRAGPTFEQGAGVPVDPKPLDPGLEMLTGPEPTSGEVGARAQRARPVGKLRQQHEVERAVEGIPHLEDRVRLPRTEPDVQRFLDRAGPARRDRGPILGRVRGSPGGGASRSHGWASPGALISLGPGPPGRSRVRRRPTQS